MLFWTTYPFLRLFMAFAIGILLARYSDLAVFIHLQPFHIVALFSGIVILKLSYRRVSHPLIGNLLLILVFLLGLLQMKKETDLIAKGLCTIKWAECKAWTGVISSFPIEKSKHLVYEVKVNSGISDTLIIDGQSKILVYVKRSDSSRSVLSYGDQILVQGRPSPISRNRNPGAFDYSAYLADQGIFLQQFVEPTQINLVSHWQANKFLAHIYRLRRHFEQVISSSIDSPKERAVIKALLLGIKSDLDPETKASYAAAGAMHILAVSGLHVSVVCLILNWIFKLLPVGKLRRFLTPILSIIALWSYALLTGFSPSIIRAATMFTIVLLSQAINRRAHVFNSLSLAAFILLLLEPKYLFNVGFQLSFLAVGGILYLYPKISALWTIHNRLGKAIWQITCVSLAAQLATFPLSLYYFHSFPTYFLLTNLVVIPGAFIVMILGIGLLSFGWLHDGIGWILKQVVSALNYFVEQIHLLDGSSIDWIYISSSQALLLYTLILAATALLQFKRTSYAWLMLFAVIGIAGDQSFRLMNQAEQNELLFYSTRKNLILDNVNGLHAQIVSTDSLINIEHHEYEITPFRREHLLPFPEDIKSESTPLAAIADMQVIAGKKILFLNQRFDTSQISEPFQADIVVISNQCIDNPDKLSQIFSCEQIILDSSNGARYIDNIKNEASSLGMTVINLKEKYHRVSLSRNQIFLNMFFK
ncbi:MAG: ComEC/Rec2 family competence protein [Reichenbachiella sp.]|uniref:ComEC/Rec2 family competence protein n=1 Tax=Reichenbachiella sp. TaxID=2184521 RepID=UPI003267AEA9